MSNVRLISLNLMSNLFALDEIRTSIPSARILNFVPEGPKMPPVPFYSLYVILLNIRSQKETFHRFVHRDSRFISCSAGDVIP